MRDGCDRNRAQVGPLLAGSPVPLSAWELWACASTVLKNHGDNTALHVAEQIGALVLKGDDEGIRTWQEIAKRIEKLQASAEAPGTRH